MKFLEFTLGVGAALILAPILHNAYLNHLLAGVAPAIASANGNVEFAPLNDLYGAVSIVTGLVLTLTSFYLGFKRSGAQ